MTKPEHSLISWEILPEWYFFPVSNKLLGVSFRSFNGFSS